jgi:hypothetical protein
VDPSSAIDLSAVADGDDEHHEHVVPHFVNCPIVAHANSKAGIVAREFAASLRSRILGQRVHEEKD